MVLKSLKSKIAAGVVGVSLVAGMSTVFAGVDAGEQFTNWYSSLFSKTSSQVGTKVATDYAKQLNAYNTEYNTLKNGSTQAVKDEATAQGKAAVDAVNSQKDTYVSQIEGAANKIDVAGDFTKFVGTTNNTVDAGAKQAADYAKRDLDKALNTQGTQSVAAVNTQVGQAQTSATDELTKKITDTKAAIQTLVNEQAATADQAIREHINGQIEALRTQLTQYADDLVKAKKADVDTAAATAQKTATDALDVIAASINK
ncbi:hypothetical protein [Paenibacillus pinistramenti]|uniref:hypothetical protein n=1 Tax=Paenibacillus pinistramenti TaxID=1768003 RepID=UPI001108A195|nr:hypothetical protein [Paenibacillus pinistramenti]